MSFVFPDWLEPHYITDELLGEAYASVPDNRRALLKTCIARLWEWYGVSRTSSQAVERSFRGGFVSRELRRPMDFAVIACGADHDSPAQLLAAAVPAVAAGVRNVLAVKPKTAGWSLPQLVALELAGIESVIELELEEMNRLLRDLAHEGGTGRMVFVNAAREASVVDHYAFGVRPLLLESGASVVYHAGAGPRFDLEAIAFGQAGTPMTCLGEKNEVDSPDFSCANREIEYLLQVDARVAFLPVELHAQMSGRFPVVLGPGHEACWVWTEIDADTFVDTKVCWADGEEL